MRNGHTVERLEEEIQDLIDQGAEQGVITRDEGEILQNVFELGETVAREIMIPRTSIMAVDSNASIREILDLIINHGFTRLPVYDVNIDQIEGLLHAKDILNYWGAPEDAPLPKDIIRAPIFVPESKKIVDLLAELKARKSHMAIILDEYGGTAGLVTLEDIIEEIVGDIHDEYDVEEEPITFIDESTILIDARLDIEDLEEYLNIEMPEGDYETVGGFITDLIGRVPQVDEKVEFRDLLMTIKSADERKINQIEIKLSSSTISRSAEPS